MPIITGVELCRRHQSAAWVTIHASGISLREISVSRREGESACKIDRPNVVGRDARSRAAYSFSGDVWREVTARINELWLLTDRAIHRGETTPMTVKWGAE